MNTTELKLILEATLMVAAEPLSIDRLIDLFDESEQPDKKQVAEALAELEKDCETRSFEVKEVASGYRLQVKQDFSPYVAKLWDMRPARYSRALLETLALIAYKQPITRGQVEEVRGVAVSSNIVKTLLERGWVKVVGHRDVPGKPALYATTKQFLDDFNLTSLTEMPTLKEIVDLDQVDQQLQAQLALAKTEEEQESEQQIDEVEIEQTDAIEDEPVEGIMAQAEKAIEFSKQLEKTIAEENAAALESEADADDELTVTET